MIPLSVAWGFSEDLYGRLHLVCAGVFEWEQDGEVVTSTGVGTCVIPPGSLVSISGTREEAYDAAVACAVSTKRKWPEGFHSDALRDLIAEAEDAGIRAYSLFESEEVQLWDTYGDASDAEDSDEGAF